MNPVAYVIMALEGISRLAVNPALGGGGYSRERLVGALGALKELILGGQQTYAELKRFATEIKALADSGAEPSRGQWEALVTRDAAARAAIEENKARLLQEMEDEAPPPPPPPPEDPPAGDSGLTVQ